MENACKKYCGFCNARRRRSSLIEVNTYEAVLTLTEFVDNEFEMISNQLIDDYENL